MIIYSYSQLSVNGVPIKHPIAHPSTRGCVIVTLWLCVQAGRVSQNRSRALRVADIGEWSVFLPAIPHCEPCLYGGNIHKSPLRDCSYGKVHDNQGESP